MRRRLIERAAGIALGALGLGVLGIGAAGCAETAADLQVKYAASSDLECDISALQVTDSQPYKKRIEGCGRAISYVRQCPASNANDSAWASRCQWAPEVEEPDDDE